MDISRRNFLKLGAAGTAAAGLAGLTGCAPLGTERRSL